MIRTAVRDTPRAVAYLLSGVLVGLVLLVVLLLLGTLGLALAPVPVGLPLLALAVLSGVHGAARVRAVAARRAGAVHGPRCRTPPGAAVAARPVRPGPCRAGPAAAGADAIRRRR
ncbi:sensor domain-containing protein [Streptomyces ipomoeae]|uniref:sensor domain-containing protein n=1 Tax=Streptomyces ipomoeae TaxID=103232 RepID=UPI0015F0B32B|nr:sensor domain-containing protein [Streptomyces ipomoeae]MDX2936949.1 sensor domain-containing protein [Streptomyces ipomoeae]